MFIDVKVCLRYVITINKIMGSSVYSVVFTPINYWLY